MEIDVGAFRGLRGKPDHVFDGLAYFHFKFGGEQNTSGTQVAGLPRSGHRLEILPDNFEGKPEVEPFIASLLNHVANLL
jgi:hypothetical protein